MSLIDNSILMSYTLLDSMYKYDCVYKQGGLSFLVGSK